MTVFAGPNGAGKSTIISGTDFVGKNNLLEADAIARMLSPSDPARAAVAAGRQVIDCARRYIEAGESFAIETTLSGVWAMRIIRAALAGGFAVRVFYICVHDPELCVQRVRERVAQGGHAVPEADIRRRYSRSLANLRQIVSVVHHAVIFDNSRSRPVLVLEIRSGSVVLQQLDRSLWAKGLIG